MHPCEHDFEEKFWIAWTWFSKVWSLCLWLSIISKNRKYIEWFGKRAFALAYRIYFLIDFLFLWSAKTCWSKSLENINYQTNEHVLNIVTYINKSTCDLEFLLMYFSLQNLEKKNSMAINHNLSNQRFFRHWCYVGIYPNKCKWLIFLPKFPFQTNYLTNDIIRSDLQRYFCSKW